MSESPVLVEKMSTDIRKKDVNLSEVCLLEESVSLSGGSFQPMHSLLLCPAQWSALLESPISLVRQPTDDEEKADIKHISNSNMDDVAGEGRPPNTEQLSERLTNIIIYIYIYKDGFFPERLHLNTCKRISIYIWCRKVSICSN